MLPKAFKTDGVLAQDYDVTFKELKESILVRGPNPRPADWNEPWRRILVDNLEIVVRQLWADGIKEIHIDGSFVENKGHPGDIDGCFQCDYDDWTSGALAKRLNAAAPKKIWTWDSESRRSIAGFTTPKLPMWCSYRVELYPYSEKRPNGVLTKVGEFRPFPEAYRYTKDGRRKGILKLIQD